MAHSQDKHSALGQGVTIFIYLAILTLLEYFVAVSFNATSLLVVMAVSKAALVMYYYMHIYKLGADDGATRIPTPTRPGRIASGFGSSCFQMDSSSPVCWRRASTCWDSPARTNSVRFLGWA